MHSRWDRLQELYLAALDLRGEERERLLAAADVDDELRQEVIEMLAVTGTGGLEVEKKLLDDGGGWSERSLSGRSVGRYRLLERIGRGGMGDVFRARRVDDEIGHEVALKLLRTSALSPDTVARFRAEQAILARLDHPAIVGLIDTGMTDDGQPYFVMPIVRGKPITDWCDERRASIEERLDLFRSVCDAVHHAHRNLVVHRDLKPSNVLVTEEGAVQLLDFGIAKLMDAEAGDAITRTGSVMMTPEYASPEQVRGESPTTAVDVYSLGVLLHELLSGSRPHRIEDGSRATLERAICEESPARLTASLNERAAAARGTSKRDLDRRLRGDLQTIVGKAMQKEPERRYRSAADLSEDIDRWRKSLPLRARPDTWSYRARTFVRRNRAATVAGGAIAVALVATLVMSTVQSRRVAAERDRLTSVVGALTDVFGTVDPIRTPGVDTLTVGDFLTDHEATILKALEGDPLLETDLALTFGSLHHSRENWSAADSLLQYAYERRSELLGATDPATIDALQALVAIRTRMGATDAPVLARRLVDSLRRSADEPTPQLAQAISDLAMQTTSWSERRTLLTEMLEIRSVVCEDDPVCHALGHNAVATACFERDSLEAAAVHFEESLRHLLQAVAPDHPHALTVKQNLATCLTATGHAARAESLFSEIIEHERLNVGDRTTRIGVNLNNLALAQLADGKRQEALRVLEASLDVLRDSFGPVHSRVANTAFNLFRLHVLRGDRAAAAAAHEATLAACPPQGKNALEAYRAYGALLDMMDGRPHVALEQLLAWRESFPIVEDNRTTINLRFVLAQCLIETGDREGAEREFDAMRRYFEARGSHRTIMLAAIDGGLALCRDDDDAGATVARALDAYENFGLADYIFVRQLRDYLERKS